MSVKIDHSLEANILKTMDDSFLQVSFNNKSFRDGFKSLTLQIRHQQRPESILVHSLMDLLFNVYDYVFGFCLSPEFAIENSRNLPYSISALME